MFYIGVFIFGVISLARLSQELYPPITYPQLSIVTPYANAAPEEIETLITKPIEEAVGGISGIRKVSSVSREGLSLVVVEFGWSQSMDFASLNVREKIDLIKERLPRDASEPVVIKFNPFELPVMSISISSDERSPVQLRELCKKWFKDEIEKINGVASASLSGGAEEQILVDIDHARLLYAGVAINEVTDAISKSNLNYPGGTIKESFYEYLVRTLGEFKRLGEVGEIPIRRVQPKDQNPSRTPSQAEQGQEERPSNKMVFLRDVADISRAVKERTSYSRFNARENVTIAVQKQASGNAIRIASDIRKKLKELQEQLPKDIHIDIIYDQSKFIQQALSGVSDSAVSGGWLTFLVLLVFLRNAVASSVVVTIIPVTVIATFTLMFFMGISLNIISLGGVALGVGMLVDCAIVVLENVYRKLEEAQGEIDIRKLTGEATEEVIVPLLSSTLTTVAVFLPLVFVTGIAGQIFKQLAWVVCVTQIISIIVSVTLLPVFISMFLKPPAKGASVKEKLITKIMRRIDSILVVLGRPIEWAAAAYERALPKFIDQRGIWLILVTGIFAASIWLFGTLDKVMMPKVDQGQFMVKVDMPVGTRLEITNRVAEQIERYIQAIDEVASVSVAVGSSRGEDSKDVVERLGSHQAQITVVLKEGHERPTEEVTQQVRQHFELGSARTSIFPASLNYVLYEGSFTGGGNDAPVIIDIKGPKLETLHDLAQAIEEKIAGIEGLYGITDSIPEPFPETKILINKDRASVYRLSVTQIAQGANIAIKGFTASKFKEEGREMDIRVQLKEKDRDRLEKIGLLTMHTVADTNVPLADFVRFQTGKGPSEIKRVSQERTVQVFAKVYKRSLKDVNADVQAVLDKMRVPHRYTVKMGGESEEVKESLNSLIFAFTLSIALVYMIMAAQFESLLQPFIIMVCVPLSLIGVSTALWISHTPISVVAVLGIILLAGIAVNNGIILIDFTNSLKNQGVPAREAAIQAGKVRLRPILMTALTSIFGLIPLAMGIAEGSELQSPMARAVLGGMTTTTFLTLFVVPAIYVGIVQSLESLGKLFRRKPSGAQQAASVDGGGADSVV